MQTLKTSIKQQLIYLSFILTLNCIALSAGISGYVKTASGEPISGVSMEFSNGGGTVITDSSGYYVNKFSDGWSGYVYPSKQNYYFNPQYREYGNVTTHQTNQNYTGNLLPIYIVGYVKNLSYDPMSGVTLSFGKDLGKITTDVDGYYAKEVPRGWSGTVTPDKDEYYFSPSSRTYSNVTSTQNNQDYDGWPTTVYITGWVRTENGDPISDVIMTSSNGGTTAITDKNGYYLIGVWMDWSGTVTLSKEGYTFDPIDRPYNNVRDRIFDQNYTGAPIPPIYVKKGSVGNGSSWANAFGNLQDALDIAEPGDEIWVATGTYKPTYDYGLGIGERGNHFRMKNGVAIYGGFAGNEDFTIFDLADRDFITNETILSGDLEGNDNPDTPIEHLRDVYVRKDNSFHVFYHPEGWDLNDYAVLNGITIAGGNANAGDYYYNGGGMFNYDSSPRIENCTFTNNSAGRGGGLCNFYSSPSIVHCVFRENMAYYNGGMDNFSSSPTVRKCIFSGNMATSGESGGMGNRSNSSPNVSYCQFKQNFSGGMSNIDSNPIVTNCTFTGNYAGGQNSGGGGMYNYYSSPMVLNCIFNGNIADAGGGGMCNYYSNPTLTNCVFTHNEAFIYGNGGGMYNSSSNPTITNCIFIDNASSYGGGMKNSNCSPTITNSIFWSNTATSSGNEIYNNTSTPIISYSNIAGCLNSGTWNTSLGTDGGGNMDEDPMFNRMSDDGGDGWGDDSATPDIDEGANDDYGDLRLRAGSPCIDAADGDVALDTDILGNPRRDDSGLENIGIGEVSYVDMGAYEFQGTTIVTIGKQGCTPTFWKTNPNQWSDTYGPNMLIRDVFTSLESSTYSNMTGSKSNFGTDTLLDALNYSGGRGLDGATRNLLRHATAALLNASNEHVDYPIDESLVIDLTNRVLDTEDVDFIQELHSVLAEFNEYGCPMEN